MDHRDPGPTLATSGAGTVSRASTSIPVYATGGAAAPSVPAFILSSWNGDSPEAKAASPRFDHEGVRECRLANLLGELLRGDNLEAEFLLYQLPHRLPRPLGRPETAECQRLP